MKFPDLDVLFRETYAAAKAYLEESSNETLKYSKLIVIAHSFYKDESKNFLDIYQLLQERQLSNAHMIVYTLSRKNILERHPNLPKEVEVIDVRKELLTFLDRCLNQ